MAHTIVIFGASGDLTSRKLVPALYQLHRKRRLPADTLVVGFSRTTFTDMSWRDELAKSTASFLGEQFDRASWLEFAPQVYYQPGDISALEDVVELGQRLDELERDPTATRLYYLATAPDFTNRRCSTWPRQA